MCMLVSLGIQFVALTLTMPLHIGMDCKQYNTDQLIPSPHPPVVLCGAVVFCLWLCQFYHPATWASHR